MELVYFDKGWKNRYDQKQVFIRLGPLFFNYGESGFLLIRGNRSFQREAVWR